MKSIFLLSLLYGVASVAARGVRIGGGGSGGSLPSDNWDAPGTLKASMAFQIIWCLGGLVELYYLIKNVPFIPNKHARAPYYMLIILMMMFSLAYLLFAIETRLSTDGNPNALNGLGSTVNIFLNFVVAFQPGVILYITHQRAFLLRTSQAKAFNPLQAQIWKRIFDWALCAILFLILLTLMAINTNENVLAIKDRLSYQGYLTYSHVFGGFSHTSVAVVIIIAINVFVGLLTLWLAQRRHHFSDPVITRLLTVAFPFLAVYALENLITEIYSYVQIGYNRYDLLLAEVIIEGICRLGITAGIIMTLTAPGVTWNPPPPSDVPPANMAYAHPGYPNYQPGWPQPVHAVPYQPASNPQPAAQPYSIPMTVSHT